MRKFEKFTQSIAEKAGKAEKTNIGDEYKQMEQATEAKRIKLEALASEARSYLQSSGKSKFFVAPTSSTTRHTLLTLGSQMISCGSSLSESSLYGNSLIKCGESFEKVGQYYQETESKISDCFLSPLLQTIDTDLKEWQQTKKKVESRRLDFDAKQSKVKSSKAPKEADENEMQAAKAKFDESVQAAKELMQKILISNEEQEVQALVELVEAQRLYFEKGLEVMKILSKELVDPNIKGTRRNEGSDTNLERKASTLSNIPSSNSSVQMSNSTSTSSLDKKDESPDVEVEEKPVPKARKKVATPGAVKQEKRVGNYVFKAENPDELDFEKGDIIIVLEKSEDGWWRGQIGERIGVFPVNYTGAAE